MNALIRDAGYSGRFFVYPTTYGIGVWIFYNWNAGNDIANIENILKSNNIDFTNEYSDKRWVYRFKIARKEADKYLAKVM